MILDVDPRLPIDGGMSRLVTRLYEVLRSIAQANNRRAVGFVAPVAVVSANYVMQTGDCVVCMSAAGGARSVTLISPAEATGKFIAVRKTESSANSVTITPPSGLINGAASLALTAASPSALLVSDGDNFFTV